MAGPSTLRQLRRALTPGPTIFTREEINAVLVSECGEPLEEVTGSNKLKVKNSPLYLRRTAHALLHLAADSLPESYTMILIDGWRSVDDQRLSWEREYAKIKKNRPNLPDEEVHRLTRLFIAEPTGSGPHQTGGALDVTLGDVDGREFFMGTEYATHDKKTPTHNSSIEKEHKKLRKIIWEAMKKSGFVNYPLEWWHYSFGDRLWAVYRKLKKCLYGPTAPTLKQPARRTARKRKNKPLIL